MKLVSHQTNIIFIMSALMPKKSRCNKNKRGVDVTKFFVGNSHQTLNYTNNRASNNSLKIGERAEDDFQKIFNFVSLPVSRDEQRREHIDVRLVDTENKFKTGKNITTFEIKAAKRINRYDNKFDYDNITVELLGITGHPGWIFSKADYICFQIKNKWWLFVPPTGLVDFVLNNLSIGINDVNGNRDELLKKLVMVERNNDAIDGKMYSRRDRKDLMTRYSVDLISKIPGCLLFDDFGREQNIGELKNNTWTTLEKKHNNHRSKIVKSPPKKNKKVNKNRFDFTDF